MQSAEVLEGLRARHEAGESPAMVLTDLDHVAWASVHFSCIITQHTATKMLALAMRCQSQGRLPTSITDIGIIVFGAGLVDVVSRISSLSQLDPPWTLKVGPELTEGHREISIERTLVESEHQQQ